MKGLERPKKKKEKLCCVILHGRFKQSVQDFLDFIWEPSRKCLILMPVFAIGVFCAYFWGENTRIGESAVARTGLRMNARRDDVA